MNYFNLNIYKYRPKFYHSIVGLLLYLGITLILLVLEYKNRISVYYLIIFMIFGSFPIAVFISRLMYKRDGILSFNEHFIKTEKSTLNIKCDFNEIEEAEIYYLKGRNFDLHNGVLRYYEFGPRSYEQEHDRIIMGGKKIFLKVRNEEEYEIFLWLIEYFKMNVKHLKIFSVNRDLSRTDEMTLEYSSLDESL